MELRWGAGILRELLLLSLGMAVTLSSASAMAGSEQEVRSGELRGTLTMPEGSDSVPAVLILAGSGPVDRDGNLPNARNDSLKLLAQGLAAYGIASLRTDKRGIGGSKSAATREEDLRFGTYVSDAVDWLDFLRTQNRVTRVIVLGHSEGALVATLAAQRTSVSGSVMVAGAGEPAAAIIERQLAAAGVPSGLQIASRRITESLLKGNAITDVPPELQAIYRPSAQQYLMSWLPIDPAKELSKLSVPILVVQGTSDLQISIDDAKRLVAASPTASLAVVEGMNHVLKSSSMERKENLLSYNDPERPLADRLVPIILDFLVAP
ncbi:alpha/beta fold hydrolase [Neorhizobium sp. LMR1-1-1.1]